MLVCAFLHLTRKKKKRKKKIRDAKFTIENYIVFWKITFQNIFQIWKKVSKEIFLSFLYSIILFVLEISMINICVCFSTFNSKKEKKKEEDSKIYNWELHRVLKDRI